MTLKTFIIGAVLLMLGIGAVLIDAITVDPGSGMAPSHAQSHERPAGHDAAIQRGTSDRFGCHTHGAVKYHCH